ncbi:hypothetical protein [Fontivita pretiosa]|uniref:hypothetical protein n=1 Tax=Fontivita pretiosa TaxID=2989684 RepID=UPI003D1706DA
MSPDAGPTTFTQQRAETDRRRRPRLRGVTLGWIMPHSGPILDPWEVRVQDVSRYGVGFISCDKLEVGQLCRIRIGRGPLELSRIIRVVRCDLCIGGVYSIGAEFV